MIGLSGNVPVYLACGVTDMRRGIDGLSAMVKAVMNEAPGSGAVFGFRGKRADRIKLLWWDGQGFCLFYKVLERGYFPWPTAKDGVAHLTQGIPPGAAAFQCLGAEGRLALCSVMVGSVHERDNGHKFAGQAAA